EVDNDHAAVDPPLFRASRRGDVPKADLGPYSEKQAEHREHNRELVCAHPPGDDHPRGLARRSMPPNIVTIASLSSGSELGEFTVLRKGCSEAMLLTGSKLQVVAVQEANTGAWPTLIGALLGASAVLAGGRGVKR